MILLRRLPDGNLQTDRKCLSFEGLSEFFFLSLLGGLMFTDGSIKVQLYCYIIIKRVFQKVQQEFRVIKARQAGSPSEEPHTLRDSDTQLFATVFLGTKFVACVAHNALIVSTVLPACIQDAN